MSIFFGLYNSQGKESWDSLGKIAIPTIWEAEFHHNQTIFFQSLIRKSRSNTQAALLLDPESKITILADARIFNRNELMKLFSYDDKKTMISDCHLILRAYQKWGTECVNKLIGDFVFAVWDPTQEQLFLARDPMGQRSLFYSTAKNNRFCFANSPKPLFDMCGISRELNSNEIADFLTLIPSDPTSTFFRHVQRLAAGHFLLINKTRQEPLLKCYWSMETICENPLRLSSREEYYSYFCELYQSVIAERLMIAGDKVGCHLSGGLDSSSITSLAAHLLQQQNKSITAFSHVPTSGHVATPKAQWNYADIPYMEAVKKKYDNVSLNFIHDNTKRLFEYCDQLHPWLDVPTFNPSNMLWILMCAEEAERQGIHTIMTGQIGNFTISWGGPAAKKVSFPRRINRHLRRYHQSWFEWTMGRRTNKPWGHISAIHEKLSRQTNLLPRYKEKNLSNASSHADDIRVLLFKRGLLMIGSGLHTAIRCVYDVEHWDPTADKRIVEFCLRIPYDIFQQGKRSRLLVRDGLREIVPQMICDRTTQGMQSADWYKKLDRQKSEIQQILKSWGNTLIADYIDVEQLLKKLKDWEYERVSTSTGKNYVNYEFQYQFKLLRAVETGKFLSCHSLGHGSPF